MRFLRAERSERALPAAIEWMVSFGAQPGDPHDVRRLKRVLAGALWLSLIPNTTFTTLNFTSGRPLAGLTLLFSEFVLLGTLVVWELRPDFWPNVFHFLMAGNFVVLIAMTALFGGFAESGANFVWGFAAMLAAVAVFRDHRSVAWLVAYVVLLIGTEAVVSNFEPRYELEDANIQSAVTVSVVAVFVFIVLLSFIRQRDELQKQSDDLLRNVLPDEIAERLKASGDMIADHFDGASILFADVVGFTPMSAGMTPAEIVGLLNEVFSVFDDLVEQRGLEKIKTVGDEYMVAAGVPQPRSDHAHALADLALAMRDYVASHRVMGRMLAFRIGINSGPVVAGIIGRKKFSYDLWGDAVNMASRMESHGEPGKIQISATTHALLGDAYICNDRGTIDVKGKGKVPVWYLESRLDAVQPEVRGDV